MTLEATLPDDEPRLSADEAITVVRVLQEALTNVRKHAEARRIQVGLRCGRGEVTLVVEDDGRGFSPGAAGAGHYGLLGMRERALLRGGRLEIDSRPGMGTRVVLHLPVRQTQ